MLPPVPAATQVYGSPNACNLCHIDEESGWAEEWVERWYGRSYQDDYMFRAGLVDAARKRDWSRLEEILGYIQDPQRDEVFSNSLIRLLENCEDRRKWPVLLEATRDPSPLIRSSAVSALTGYITEEGRQALIAAAADEARLVRIRAAAALSSYSLGALPEGERVVVEKATAEYEDYLRCGPDQWSSHYNMGNYYVNLGRLQDALKEFNIASRLQPQSIPPLVNASMIHARLGQPRSAENKLRRAYDVDPSNAIVNYNLGLLLAEQGRPGEARKMLEAALREDPQLYAAAYNLAILVAESDLEKAISWCRRAAEGRPEDPKYSYTLAFYLFQSGQLNESRRVLEELLQREEDYLDAYTLLGMIHEKESKMKEAAAVYRRALKVEGLPPAMRFQLENRLAKLQ
jgi:tetratricopeptide (TPR) repeat protein